jgi:hypothetical protein
LNTFLFGDQAVGGNFKFKVLPRQTSVAIFFPILVHQHSPGDPGSHDWRHEWKEADNTVTLSLALHESGFVLRFPELCDFILDTGQRHIHVLPHHQLDDDSIEHLLVDQVIPRLLAHEGHLLLHACAVNVEGRTVLFLGKSGWGKSTLAALFHHAGYALYSDDCVLLRQQSSHWQTIATYPSLRLYEDSIENIFVGDSSLSPVSEYSDKQRIALSVEQEQVPPALHAMYFLSDPENAADDIQISRMQAANTCIELIERSFRLDVDNRLQSKQLMASAAALTQSVPAFRLSYPHNFENNSELIAQLIQHIKQ